jgi:predicted transcriptional regulator
MSSESTRQPPGNDGQNIPEAVAELTDAKAMRALAHPVRLSLIDLLGYHEVLTATEASELIGESPSNCAFHLRTLAKYGFLREAAGSNRRERPWKLAYPSGVHINPRPSDPQATFAASALIRTILDRWLSRAGQVFGSPSEVPGWERVPGWSQQHVFMTPDEALATQAEVSKVLNRFEARQHNPELRPPGAHRVEWSTFTEPIAEWLPGGTGPWPDPESKSEA